MARKFFNPFVVRLFLKLLFTCAYIFAIYRLLCWFVYNIWPVYWRDAQERFAEEIREEARGITALTIINHGNIVVVQEMEGAENGNRPRYRVLWKDGDIVRERR